MLIEQWTGDDGLISNNLTYVTQSRDGFIWIASFNGAHRFDGKNFALFDKENVSILNSNAFYQIIEANGMLWFASQSSGLVMYDGEQFTKRNDMPSNSVRALYADSKGRLWIGTNNSGLFVLENDSIKSIENELVEKEIINAIIEDNDGNIWVGSGSKGLLKLEGEKVTQLSQDKISNSISALEVSGDTLAIGASNGLYLLVNNVLQRVEILSQYQINDILHEKTGSYILGTEQGLVRYDPKLNVMELLDEAIGLPANQVSKITYDHEGSLWVATKKAGLLRLYSGSIKSLGVVDGLPYDKINIIKEHKGVFYVGADDGTISILNGEKISNLKLEPFRRKLGIRDISFSEDGIVWIASYAGLLKYDDGKETLFTTNDGLSSNNIRRILRDESGNLWLATRTGGVIKWKDNKVEKIYDTNNHLKSDYILSLEMDNESNIVVGTHSGGINIIKGNEVFHYSPDSLPGVLFFNSYVDKNNDYWFATNVGIFYFSKGKFTPIKLEANFKTETFFDIVPDDFGNVWLSTNVGIVQVGYAELKEFVNGNIKKVNATIFDESDGMRISECTGATKSLKNSDGSIWIPTLDGVSIIEPAKIVKNKYVPNIIISSFTVDGKDLTYTDANIEAGSFRFRFSYSALSFISPSKIKYKYQLEGVDSDWITTADNELEYTNLDPGKYVFNVTGTNNDGVWSDKVASITFRVNPFFYETAYFYGLLIISLLLLTWVFVKIRTNRIEKSNAELVKVNKELDRFVYSASHDLRAPLASVLGLVEIGKIETSMAEKDKCFELIRQSIDKLDVFLKEIIDFSKNQRLEITNTSFNIKEFINQALDDLKYLDNASNIKIEVHSEIENVFSDQRRLSVILHNLIANAINYNKSEGGFLKISVFEKGNTLQISVEDNGRGIAKEHLERIFEMFYRAQQDKSGSGLGLYIVKETVEKLNGSIAVESKVNEGTTFTITLPIIRPATS